MTRSTASPSVTYLVALAALLLVVDAGILGFVTARGEADSTVFVDGAHRGCGPYGAVTVQGQVDAGADARFFIDGVEIPAKVERWSSVPDYSVAMNNVHSVLPCAAHAAHRFEAITAVPGGCRWTIKARLTQEEGRNAASSPPTAEVHRCALTVVA